MKKNKQIIPIYTDGSCLYNPGVGGWAAIICTEQKKGLKGAKAYTTNNEMEILAVLKALEFMEENLGENSNIEVQIHTDSAYVEKAINSKWLESWKKNGWKNAQKKEVSYKEEWQRIDEIMNKLNVKFIKVEAHADNKLNNLVDKYARQEAKDLSEKIEKKAKSEKIDVSTKELFLQYLQNIHNTNNINNEDNKENKEKYIKQEEKNQNIAAEKEKQEILFKEQEEKEQRQSETIVDLVKKIDELQKENMALKNKIAELESK